MIQSFLPIIPSEPKVLVLGTMPGIASLQQQQYYGHPRNHFWKIISYLYNETEIPNNYDEKIAILMRHKIALWDVLAFCERQGSLDVAIKNPVPNNINQLLKEQPSISKIIFNGKESRKLFMKHIKTNDLSHIEFHVVPSTSPANTIKFELKLALWREAFL